MEKIFLYCYFIKFIAIICIASSVIESKKISNTKLDLISEALKTNSNLLNGSRSKRQSSKINSFDI